MVTIDFNNKNSFDDFGLILEERPALPLTLENVENITIAGRSGTLTRRLGTYNNKEITCKFILFSKTNYIQNIDLIISWLNNITDNSLVISCYDNKTYKVKNVTCNQNIQEMLRFYGKFEATFICEPFVYSTTSTPIVSSESFIDVVNSGSVNAEPYIKLTGTGDLGITMPGHTISFAGVDGYIEIDSQNLLCYKGTNNEMDKMSGDFPVFPVGTTRIYVSGPFTSIEIDLRERYL